MSTSMSENEIIEKLSSTVANCLAEVGKEAGYTVWPAPFFNPFEAEMYLASYFYERLDEDLHELEKKLKIEDIAKLFKNPSRIAQMIWPLPFISTSKLNKEERASLVHKIIDLISCFRKDPFCEDGKNIIWPKHKIDKTLKEIKIINLETVKEADDYRKEIGKLCGSLFMYTELLYFACHAVGHEFHGPYEIEGGNQLIIREFYDLKETFWPFTSKFPFDEVLIFAIYPKEINVKFDFFNRVRSSEPLSPLLRQFSIKVRCRDKTEEMNQLDQILKLNEKLMEVQREGIGLISRLDRKSLMKEYAKMYFFILKPSRELLGKDWEPPKELCEDIERESKKEMWENVSRVFQRIGKLSLEDFKKEVMKMYDPEVVLVRCLS